MKDSPDPPNLTVGPPSPEAQSPAKPPAPGLIERRRPGRPETAKPPLIPLLRYRPPSNPKEAVIAPLEPHEGEDLEEDPDQLRTARGIAFGVLCAGVLWILLGLLLLLR